MDNFSKNLESEYEKIIAARTGKSSALPELTAPPPVSPLLIPSWQHGLARL